MAEKKKILYIVEAMGGGVFTYIVDLANELVNKYDMYIAYAVRKQTPKNYKDYFDKRIHLIEVKNFGRAINPFTVFTLGRICYQKNPTLFNTIAELLPDVRFVWIGDGELREELKSKNIEISGWVDRTTAIKYAVNADVFLLPSRWEGLPISLLESMYMRKVCVVSNVIGNRDVIHNGENGFVCSNTEEFVKAIKDAQNGADGFTERAYQDVLNMYNTKAMAKQYSEKYDKAINTPRGGVQHELILYVLTNDYATAKAVA